jgi:hypothetical protein
MRTVLMLASVTMLASNGAIDADDSTEFDNGAVCPHLTARYPTPATVDLVVGDRLFVTCQGDQTVGASGDSLQSRV